MAVRSSHITIFCFNAISPCSLEDMGIHKRMIVHVSIENGVIIERMRETYLVSISIYDKCTVSYSHTYQKLWLMDTVIVQPI